MCMATEGREDILEGGRWHCISEDLGTGANERGIYPPTRCSHAGWRTANCRFRRSRRAPWNDPRRVGGWKGVRLGAEERLRRWGITQSRMNHSTSQARFCMTNLWINKIKIKKALGLLVRSDVQLLCMRITVSCILKWRPNETCTTGQHFIVWG